LTVSWLTAVEGTSQLDSCVEGKSLEQEGKSLEQEGKSLEQHGKSLEQEDSSVVATSAAAAVNLHHDVNNITLNHA